MSQPQGPYGQQPGQWPPQYGQPPAYGYQQPYPPQQLQGRDGAQYVRQQTPHSLVKHLLFGWMLLWIPAIIYTFSKNHYWTF